MKLSRIICASDSGEVSTAVLSYAMALAEWEDADLRVVHVAGSQQHAPYVPAASGARATTVVVPGGDPAAAIVDYARGVRADLIVIGATLARPGAEQRGRLAEVVARDAHCPTLIVPLSLPYRRNELPFRNILCPVDFSPSSVLACERALRLTQQAGGTLTLLHVLDEFRNPSGDVRLLPPEDYALRLAEARARLTAAISEESLNWSHVGVHVSIGATDVHILAAAHRQGVDLIVMGLTPRPNITPGSAYSMVERVAAQAGCPVLVVRAPVGSATWEAEYEAPGRHRNSNASELSQVSAMRRTSSLVGEPAMSVE